MKGNIMRTFSINTVKRCIQYGIIYGFSIAVFPALYGMEQGLQNIPPSLHKYMNNLPEIEKKEHQTKAEVAHTIVEFLSEFNNSKVPLSGQEVIARKIKRYLKK